MNKKTKLSERLRANVEAAPWVIDEVIKIEAKVEEFEKTLTYIAEGNGYDFEHRLVARQALKNL